MNASGEGRRRQQLVETVTRELLTLISSYGGNEL